MANRRYKNFALINQTPQAQVPVFITTGYEDCVAVGNYVYCIGGGNPGLTLSIFSVVDNAKPVALSYLTTGSVHWTSGASFLNGGYKIAIDGNHLYVASSGSSYLYIVNIANPYAPFNISGLLISGTPGSIYGVAYQNGMVYLATQNTGLAVVDVGNGIAGGTLASPVQTFSEGGGVKSFGVAVSGATVYTTQYTTTSPYATRQIKSWKTIGSGTIARPVLLQSLQVTGVGEALGISLQGKTAFVTTEATLFTINLVDITNPSAMTNISQIQEAHFNSGFTAQGTGNLLYVPSGSNPSYGGAIDVYDISNRATPMHLSQARTNVPNSVFGGISLSNGYIYCADYGPISTQGNLDVFSQINSSGAI